MNVGGYMRVSRQGDRDPDKWLTIPLQRDTITGYCARNVLVLTDLRQDIDVSGGAFDRPNLEALVTQIERGELAGLVVGKLDRFSRDLYQAAPVIRRIEQAGGLFVAAADGIRISAEEKTAESDQARLLLHVLLAISDNELRRFKTQWRHSREHTIRRGRHWGPHTPFGYVRHPDTGVLEIDAAAGDLVAEVFRRRCAGHGNSEIAWWLDGLGVRTGRDGRPTPRWVAEIVKRRAYLGEAYAGEFVNTAAHTALVDVETWERAQAATGPRRQSTGRQGVLTGLLRCHACQRTMNKKLLKMSEGTIIGYRCRGDHAAGKCPDPAIVHERDLLAHVVRAYDAIVDGTLVSRTVAARVDVGELRAARARAERELAAFRDNTEIAEALDVRMFAQGLRVRQERLDEAERALAEGLRAQAPVLGCDAESGGFGDWPIEVQRRVLRAVIGAVVVKSRRHGDLRCRARLVLPEDMPDVPRSGVKPGALVAFPDFDDDALTWVEFVEPVLDDCADPAAG